MPKKIVKETPQQQTARFRAEVERMVAAGVLNPTDADKALDRPTNSLHKESHRRS